MKEKTKEQIVEERIKKEKLFQNKFKNAKNLKELSTIRKAHIIYVKKKNEFVKLGYTGLKFKFYSDISELTREHSHVTWEAYYSALERFTGVHPGKVFKELKELQNKLEKLTPLPELKKISEEEYKKGEEELNKIEREMSGLLGSLGPIAEFDKEIKKIKYAIDIRLDELYTEKLTGDRCFVR